jgi:hypothetical protein
MILLLWVFIGFLVGLFVVAIFNPPFRKIPFIPTPNDNEIYNTNYGCVRILSEEIECSPDAVSLNVIIGKK